MRYQYCFYEISKGQLISFLQLNGITYKVNEGGRLLPSFVKFNLWSDQENTNLLLNELEDMRCKPTIYVEFTESERKNAQLLWLWPKSQTIDIINAGDAYDYFCVGSTIWGETTCKHEVQKDLLAIDKEPSIKTRNAFWTESTGSSVLFASKKVVDMLYPASFEGIDFLNVLNRAGSVCENIYQMRSKHVIRRECIQFGHGEIVERCPICGSEQYGLSNSYIMHFYFERIQQQCDFYETERIFGEGIAHPIFIISQKLYRFLKANKLTGGLNFSPIYPADSNVW